MDQKGSQSVSGQEVLLFLQQIPAGAFGSSLFPACSQLKFISGLCVCLLNSLQPTDWYRQPSPVWELAEPCDFPHKGSCGGEPE